MTTPEKLKLLRDRYGANPGPKDPVFRQVTDMQFRDGRRMFPFAGVPTFLDLPYRPEVVEQADFGGLDVGLVGVPMDLGVTNRSGSRFGPRAVRTVERVGPYEHVLRAVPATECAAADIGDVPLSSRFDLAACHADIEAYFDQVVKAGVVPIAVGGDHSITQAILRSVGRERPVGMLHIDAHCDTGGPYEGSRFHHGGPFRQAVLDGVLDPERVIQIGIRGSAEYLWEFSYESGMTVIHAEELAALGVPQVIERTRAVLGDGPVYVSFDIDSVDPGFAPGTGTPEIGGLMPREVLAILRGVADRDIVGGDVVEVAPQYDATANTAHIATQVLFEIFCLASGALARRRTARA